MKKQIKNDPSPGSLYHTQDAEDILQVQKTPPL